MDYKKMLINFFREYGYEPEAYQIENILKFHHKAVEFNRHTNILGTKEPDEIFIRHFLDCLSVLELKTYFHPIVLKEKIMLDLGTGGGFPGILLAIIFNSNRFLLIEKSKKKSDFLINIINELKLENVEIISNQAEILARDLRYRGNIDYCFARAFANINILLELITPFAKINGNLFFYKSRKIYEEIALTESVMKELGVSVVLVKEVRVPFLEEFRAIEVLEKVSETPDKYPRSLSTIKKFIIQ
ncbi:MAG TPA: 16S rRNA (guanine(527)-N(7))-methyltransferase RsmG [Actinobacteria bacterium]|nr:16S rRNA (guanine(527)-N(7))-methyltransferase RsmG [Actinomycetota bacterium]